MKRRSTFFAVTLATLFLAVIWFSGCSTSPSGGVSTTNTPTPTATATPSATATPTPTSSITPTPTASLTPTPTIVWLPYISHFYKFEDNLTDSALFGTDGENSDGNLGFTAGKIGQAAVFNGSASVEFTGLSEGVPGTIAMWIYPQSYTGAILFDQNGVYNGCSRLGIDASGHLYYEHITYDTNEWFALVSDELITLDAWTYVAVTNDLLMLKLYINAELVSQESVSGANMTGADEDDTKFGFGRSLEGAPPINEEGYYAGLIDELRIYSRSFALTQQHIEYIMSLTE